MFCQNIYVSIFLRVRNVLESDIWTKEDRNIDVLTRHNFESYLILNHI
jgi:hypothetical protein